MSDQRDGVPAPGGLYARYVLGVLFLVYVFNFLDSQILSILNEAIRADLGLRDDAAGLSLRYGVRRVLRRLRPAARPARRRLGPPSS
jgi:hypothetical protein